MSILCVCSISLVSGLEGEIHASRSATSLRGCLRVYVSCFFFSSRRRHTRCLSDWSSDVCSSDLYEDHGRHEIFAGNKHVPMASKDHSLVLNAEAVAAGAQTDLDELGVAKNAREEKLAARKKGSQLSPDEIRHHMDMERLYRQEVLKEQPTIQIQGLRTGKKKQDVQPVAHKDVV